MTQVDKVLQQARQMQLKYRTKIIQIEKQLDYEKQRADSYQNQFRQAILSSQSYTDQSILKKLQDKQNQIHELRIRMIEIQKQNTNTQIQKIIIQNQDLKRMLEQIKQAAIAAIMEKQSQIQQLNGKINQKQDLQVHLSQLQQKYQNLMKIYQQSITNHQQEINNFQQKLSQNNQDFLDKLITFQKQFSHQQNIKEILIQKTMDLQGNLNSSQKIIQLYEQKMRQIQGTLNLQRLKHSQNEAMLKLQYESLQQVLKYTEKQVENCQSTIKDYKFKQGRYLDQLQSLKQEKQQLLRKVQVLNRKSRSKLSSSVAFGSADQFSKNVNIFSSFIKNQKTRQPIENALKQTLKQIKQLQQSQIIQNFTGYADIEIQNVDVTDINPQIEKLKNQYDGIIQQNKKLKDKLTKILKQNQQLTKIIQSTTQQLQQQRKISAQLRTKMKKSQKQSQLIIQNQSIKQHMFKLENALLIEKMQSVEKQQYYKERYDIQKQKWTLKLVSLTDQIAQLQTPKKKKKGFFF